MWHRFIGGDMKKAQLRVGRLDGCLPQQVLLNESAPVSGRCHAARRHDLRGGARVWLHCEWHIPACLNKEASKCNSSPTKAHPTLMQWAPRRSSSRAARRHSPTPSHTRPMPRSAAPHAQQSSPLPRKSPWPPVWLSAWPVGQGRKIREAWARLHFPVGMGDIANDAQGQAQEAPARPRRPSPHL
jgi:hypothetical protein